jgi:hypothetical protein
MAEHRSRHHDPIESDLDTGMLEPVVARERNIASDPGMADPNIFARLLRIGCRKAFDERRLSNLRETRHRRSLALALYNL